MSITENHAQVSPKSPAIEIEGLNKWFGTFHVLRDINLYVAERERIVICGPSGSGKSTLLNILGGRASYGRIQGQIEINERPFQPHVLKNFIGFVQQAYVLFEELTVFENLAYAAKLRAPREHDGLRRLRRASRTAAAAAAALLLPHGRASPSGDSSAQLRRPAGAATTPIRTGTCRSKKGLLCRRYLTRSQDPPYSARVRAKNNSLPSHPTPKLCASLV